MKKNKEYAHIKVHLINPEDNTIIVENVIDIFADQVETNSGVYYLTDAKRYHDDRTGISYLIFNLDLPAKTEAENLKKLRRSNALARIFDYDVKKPTDILKYMPYLIIFAILIFK